MDRFLYNSITPWDEDIPGQVAAIKDMGVKHVVVQAFDIEDMGPKGRVSSLKKLLPMVEKGNFESVIVDTAVMGLPLTAVSLIGNRLVKEEFGLPVGCAPSNGCYMWKKEIGPENVSKFIAADAAMEAIAAIESDFIFPGPMTALDRIYPAVAAAYSMQIVRAIEEGLPFPTGPNPLSLLFPDVVETLKK
jgi:tetrahydromethanopterin S-methyltransferase subunit H